MTKHAKPAYLAKVAKLSKIETERLLSRMIGKLPRQLEKEKLSQEEALAVQLELEDEQLQDWRKMINIIREKEKHKLAALTAEDSPKPTKKKKAEQKQQVNIKDIAPAKHKAGSKKKTAKHD
jgi:CTP synthase (UTP-ammonia lyase)